MSNEIVTSALNLFQKNLLYLEKNHSELYQKINILNLLISDGTYQERYALEYKEEGYFDLLELSSNEFFYKENSIEHANRIVDTVDLKRTGAIFYAQRFVYADDWSAEIIDKSELSFHNALWATIKIINYIKQYTTPETHMLTVGKIIFLDLGLGLHLKGVIDKLKPKVIFIKEKSVEIFRLSLFVTDYEQIAQGCHIFFSITDNEMEERTNFIPFLNLGNNLNLYMKHIPLMLNYETHLQRLQAHILSQDYINYGYSAVLLRFIDSPRYLAQGYPFINVAILYRDSYLAQKPILFLFSGPSTMKNIEWIQDNCSRFLVVSALSTCRLLHKYGIKPDVIVHIDPGEDTALLFEGLDEEYFKNTIVILASNVDEATVKKLSIASLYFIESGRTYKKGFGSLTSPSVGEYTYALFLVLGATRIFLLGVDFALDNETLQSHGELHPYQVEGKEDTESASLDFNTTIDYIPGNFLERVPTLPMYKHSLVEFEKFSDRFCTQYHEIYNLGNGAYLKGTKPLKVNDYQWENLPFIDKNSLHNEVQSFLDSISSSDFSEEDKDIIRYQLLEAKKLEKVILKFGNKTYKNIDKYFEALTKLSYDLSDMDYKTKSDLAQVYYEYFLIIISYIFDLFNTKELQSPEEHIKNINNLLTYQLLKIAHLYIERMEYYLK